MGTHRFRVAFSFAGEKRDFVRETAALLAQRFGEDSILYDDYHKAEFSRPDLAFHLPALYRNDAELVVAVLCPDYHKKEWCGLEWRAIFGLIKQRRDSEIMLARFGGAEGEGLAALAGYTDLDHETPASAAALILERLALNAGLSRNHFAENSDATARAAVPRNLPRLQHFFGREHELATIAAALAPEARGWGVLIDGPGGIGKTSLAIRAAELVPPGRFRRIIFLSAKERELTADGQRTLGAFVLPSYLEMLNALARELGVPELTKAAEAERPEAVLRALRNENVLLLLDNLETLPERDRDLLFAFLNRLSQGCSAIVTSRRRADASATIVRLDRLEWPAAKELLAELAKHNTRLGRASEGDLRSLYENTGGNPLLIRWLVGQLGLGRCRTIALALEYLRSAPAGNNPLEFIFGDLLDTFTPSESKVLAALTHFTGLLEVKTIAELADLNEAAAQGALDDLSTRALVIADQEDRRFALVPMVADFLRRFRPEAVAQTGSRLEHAAYALCVKHGYNRFDAFPILEGSWARVAAALPMFLAGPNTRLQTACDALGTFFDYSGRWDEWLSLEQRAETKALSVDDFMQAGWRAYHAGSIYYSREQADETMACALRSTEHWEKAKVGARERAVALGLLAKAHSLKENYVESIAAIQKALALDRSIAVESVDVSIDLVDLGTAERLAGDLTASEEHIREALRISRSVEFLEGTANCFGHLALISCERENWVKGEKEGRKALHLSEQIGRQESIADSCAIIAKALLMQGQPTEALPFARRAVDICARLNFPRLEQFNVLLAACEKSSETSK